MAETISSKISDMLHLTLHFCFLRFDSRMTPFFFIKVNGWEDVVFDAEMFEEEIILCEWGSCGEDAIKVMLV